ncbi:MAG TPA: hypothetical protein DDX33_00840 [Rikenellaceae bacterium]|nr:hypothetical protein [Rikenellaceae bacterium]HBH20597.1 hypothetical protein [Rikenellaceae bacterium]
MACSFHSRNIVIFPGKSLSDWLLFSFYEKQCSERQSDDSHCRTYWQVNSKTYIFGDKECD